MTKDISKRIRDLRRSMNLTQSQFAELVNLSEDSIGKIERRVSKPTIDTLDKVAQGAKITVSELLGETSQKTRSQSKAIEDLVKYLRTKPPQDVRLVHEVAVKILERGKSKK